MTELKKIDFSLVTVDQLKEDWHETMRKFFKFREETINTVSIKNNQKIIEFITEIELLEEELLKRKHPVSSSNPMGFYNIFFTTRQLLDIVKSVVTGAVYCNSGESYTICSFGEINGFNNDLDGSEDEEKVAQLNNLRELKKAIEKVVPDVYIP